MSDRPVTKLEFVCCCVAFVIITSVLNIALSLWLIPHVLAGR